MSDQAIEAGADAAWAAMCERSPGTTRHPEEAIEWKQAVEQILEDAMPALHKAWSDGLLSDEFVTTLAGIMLFQAKGALWGHEPKDEREVWRIAAEQEIRDRLLPALLATIEKGGEGNG
jgi:hypothetical protein